MSASHPEEIPFDTADLPTLTSWQWSDVLDELYAHATWLWEHDREELADAIAELADALAKHAMIGSDVDFTDADAEFEGTWADEDE